MSIAERLSADQPFWQDRPVFVTGATGLVGGHLVDSLANMAADVVCLVRDWVPQSELFRTDTMRRVRIVRGDVCDSALIERILGDYEVDTVIHLAAQTIVSVANRNPIETFESNIKGSWVILEAARRSPTVKQIVMASSDKAYGEKAELPYDEAMSLEGTHPYDVSKSCSDLIAKAYAVTYESPVCITRCGNFYGGGDLNWNRIVPGTIRSVLRNTRPVIRSDGTFIRDYIYVGDAVGAYLTLARRLAESPELRGEAFNFSNELQMTVTELVQKIIKIMKSDLEPVIQNIASNEIHAQYLSSAKAKRILGWSQIYSFDEGIQETIAWYQNYFSR